MDSEAWQVFFQKLSEFTVLKREKNIFSLGGRGHYENPISDILKFFLNPNEEHGLRDLVLSCLVECLPNSANLAGPLTLEDDPKREYRTALGNRIDILLNGSDWVIVLENKIRHDICNPFNDYADDVKAKFCSKKLHFLILAPNKPDKIPSGWTYVAYKMLLGKIRDRLGARFIASGLSKWTVFLREFLMNIEDQIPGAENQAFKFVAEHYSKFAESLALHTLYLEHLLERIVRSAEEHFSWPVIKGGPWDWKPIGWALGVFPWKGRKEYVALLVCPDGRFRIQYYVGEAFYDPRREIFINETFPTGELERGGIYCLSSRDFQNNLADALAIFGQACDLLKQAI